MIPPCTISREYRSGPLWVRYVCTCGWRSRWAKDTGKVHDRAVEHLGDAA